MITMAITGFFMILNFIGTITGITQSVTTTTSVLQPLANAITTVNGYLAYTFYFIPKPFFVFILGITLAVTFIRISMAIINLIAW